MVLWFGFGVLLFVQIAILFLYICIIYDLYSCLVFFCCIYIYGFDILSCLSGCCANFARMPNPHESGWLMSACRVCTICIITWFIYSCVGVYVCSVICIDFQCVFVCGVSELRLRKIID